MTDKICFETRPAHWNFTDLVCEAAPEASVPDAPPSRPSFSASSTLVPTASLWKRNSAEWRSAILDSAFTNLATPALPVALRRDTLAYGALALLPVGCSNQELPSAPNGDGGSSGSGGGDGGIAGSDGGSGPSFPMPRLEGFETHSTSPCGAEGVITDLDNDIGVCANDSTGNHHLFSWNPNSSAATHSIVSLPFIPDQATRGAGGEIYLSTYGAAGLAVINPSASTSSSIVFPATLPLYHPADPTSDEHHHPTDSSSGRYLDYVVPSFPKGIVEIDGAIFIATSNYDQAHHDYHPGSVLKYHPGDGSFSWIMTSGYNPTGLANVGGTLMVVSSGALDQNGVATTESFLDAFDPATGEELHSLSLGICGAGLSGDLALSEDGSMLVLPTADNSGRLLVINLLNFEKHEVPLRTQGLNGAKIFFPSILLSEYGQFAFASNFNDGRVYGVDLTQGKLAPTSLSIDTNFEDTLGLSDGLRVGSQYFIGMGPDILRLRMK